MPDHSKVSWIASKNTAATFLIAASMTIFSFISVVALSLIAETISINVEDWHWHSGSLTFWSLFALLAIFIVAQCYLCVSMVWALITFDDGSFGSKVLWFALIFCGGPWGAATYHFVRYRSLLKRKMPDLLPARS